MYIPRLSHTVSRSISSDVAPLNNAGFSLDTSGMASFFGGDVAVSAMTTLHLDPTRRWLGWYNSPGTYEVARRYGRVAKSRFLEGLFPGMPTDLVTLLGLGGIRGGKYISAYNGTILQETGPFSALLMQECRRLPGEEIQGRVTLPIGVSITELKHVPDSYFMLKRTPIYPPAAAIIPISTSIGAAVACALFEDWFCFAMITLGILVNGISCLVFGSGEFIFQYPVHPIADPSGDGIIVSEQDGEIVIVKGNANAVDSIIRGAFVLQFKTAPNYPDIEWCSNFLIIQFIAQLLLIPQGTLFGQLMFVGSLGVSWAYNMWLSSWNMDAVRREVCVRGVLQEPVSRRYILGTRTSAVIFTLLVLRPDDPAKFMDLLVPNDTLGWRKFKGDVLSRISNNQELRFDSSSWKDHAVADEMAILQKLYQDAEAAYQGYLEYYVPHVSMVLKI
ncbi:hypothetical protein ID866_9765 [Astraeus odoratus]|nr:hypothetical protein ID866_9765 [Astraeus odoratus]